MSAHPIERYYRKNHRPAGLTEKLERLLANLRDAYEKDNQNGKRTSTVAQSDQPWNLVPLYYGWNLDLSP